jgi:RTX calcium-binding nonapeptide repeat (4 copies)
MQKILSPILVVALAVATTVLLLVAVLAASSTAFAKTVRGGPGGNRIVGTTSADTLYGFAGRDLSRALPATST